MESVIQMTHSSKLTDKKLMGWFESILARLFPALGMVLVNYMVFPYLNNFGIAPFVIYLFATILVMIAMLCAAFIGLHYESNTRT